MTAAWCTLDCAAKLLFAFLDEWNVWAHPFNWTINSFDKVLAKIDVALAQAA